MKKFTFSIFLQFLIGTCSLFAQPVFYGLSRQGGGGTSAISVGGDGTIYKFNTDGNLLTAEYKFGSQNPGKYPAEELIQLPNGKLYGMTTIEGAVRYGTIFSFDPLTNEYSKLFDFDGTDGLIPSGGLVRASNGKLYGITQYTKFELGTNGYGTLFSFDPETSIHTKLFEFGGDNGANPVKSLVQASNGILYGTTPYGGVNGNGILFSFDPSTNAFTKIFDFDGTNGSFPSSSLINATDGKLYGTTSEGGTGGSGVIFSFDPVSNNYNVESDFSNSDLANPKGLIQLSDGRFFGITSESVFSFDPGTKNITGLADFALVNGGTPNGLTEASDGKLYGTTRIVSLRGIQAIFSFDPATNQLEFLDDFTSPTRTLEPRGKLFQASDGKLYGTTYGYRDVDRGTIFSFDIQTKTRANLFDFRSIYGRAPFGSLVEISGGKLCGIAFGGVDNLGIIFSFDPSLNSFNKLYDFTNGEAPGSRLIAAHDQKLYGTSTGGVYGYGTIFSLDPETKVYTKMFDFGVTNGSGQSLQALSSDGIIYGTANGGAYGYGTLFSYDPQLKVYTQLFNFNGTNGANPNRLISSVDGKLYGITYGGGVNGAGTIFAFDVSTNTHSKLYDFDGTNGSNPNSLVSSGDGVLYGIAEGSGANSAGTIFSFDLSTNRTTKVFDFEKVIGGNGGYYGGLVMSREGKLYGTSSNGAIGMGDGSIFSFDLATNSFEKLQDFNGGNGYYPVGDLLEYKTCSTEICDGIDNDCDGLIDEDCGSPDQPKVYISNTRVIEGDHGISKATFLLWLDRKPKTAVKLSYKTVDQTAQSPDDYFSKSGEITFEPNTLVKTISVQVKGDNQPEPNENFKVVLENLENANPGKIEGVATIIDDDSHSYFGNRKDDKFHDPHGNPHGGNGWQVHVLPNPSTNRFQVDLLGETGGKILLRVTDIAGRVIEERNLDANTRQVNLGEKWKQGSYILELTSGAERKTIQLVKLK